jgi:hypothetical protein
MRLVTASRSKSPDYKILPFPHRQGDALGVTTGSEALSALSIEAGGEKRTL